ncbi:MAG: NAD(P)-binding domain-containing protein [Crocinitomicaceae bacterium]|nr:NAD(P)-binding domain-containing protein [Crocinitomicaceae bacterium]
MKIGIIGAGAMGSGIAQVAANAGNEVVLCDSQPPALEKSRAQLVSSLGKLVEKNKMSREAAEHISGKIHYNSDIESLSQSDWVIEAIVEDLTVKKSIFSSIEKWVSPSCVLASNTSSLSITAIAAACEYNERVIGIHFFNPAPLMPLVEIIPGLQTAHNLPDICKKTLASWGKNPVIAKDTPGFIVNRIARPFYGEALRIYEEGIADISTIDAAMRDQGFRLGPFELMDMIGNDVNYAVTESVFAAFYFDPRFRPSLTQKRMVEAGWLGKKSGRGFYMYQGIETHPKPSGDTGLRKKISSRIIAMLINEAYDALYLGIAGEEDIDMAMTKGVNYPKGLIKWGREIGIGIVVEQLDALYKTYREDRYRCSPIMRI